MADPLSVSAGIVGLVSLAEGVSYRVFRYVKAVKNASNDISSLAIVISALYGVLTRLHLLYDQLKDDIYESRSQVNHIQSCYVTLAKAKSILDRDDTTSLNEQRVEILKRKLRWPFSSSEVKDLVAEIDRHKSTLGLALQIDAMAGLLCAFSRQKDLSHDLKEIKSELEPRREAETRITIDKQRQEVLNSFGSIDPRQSHEMNQKLRHPNTGLWLTESFEFRTWLHTPDECLWLYGIPGAGKTVLASLLIDAILSMGVPNTVVAYFYCDYNVPESQKASAILGYLVQQIAKQDEESFSKTQAFYETHNYGRRHPIDYDPQELRHLIVTMAMSFEHIRIAVDGLDECGSHTAQVTELLSTLHSDQAAIQRLLVSRDEYDIRQHLEGYPAISIAARSSDLKLYVGAELENRIRNKKLNIRALDLKETVRNTLVDGAEGMYVDSLNRLTWHFIR